MKTKIICLIVIFLTVAAPLNFTKAQTGGGYDISHSVVAAGGGSNSTGGSFTVDGTIGQPLAGTLSGGGNYSLRSGFWAFDALAPTAAPVRLSGRVSSGKGLGIIRRVKIVLLDVSTGIERTTQTNSFGDYQFEELQIGHFYFVRAVSRNYTFTPESYFLELLEDRDEVNFTARTSLLK